MKVQKGLLLIPAVLSFAWGILGLFVPSVIFKMLAIPAATVTPEFLSTQSVLAVSQVGLGLMALWMRTLADKKSMAGAMTIVSVIFLLFGLQAVLQNLYIEGLARNTVILIQGIVMLLLAVVFFVKRKPE